MTNPDDNIDHFDYNGPGSGEDDLFDYNNLEAEDYENEGPERDVYDMGSDAERNV